MKNTKHGLKTKAYQHPLYVVWQTLRHRAEVVEIWNDFTKFIEDVGDRPGKGRLKALDRNKPYGPDNFWWQTGKKTCETAHVQKDINCDDGKGYFKHCEHLITI
jgi:hypothetical protein